MSIAAQLRTDVVVRLRSAGCVFAEQEAALLLDSATSSAQLESWIGRRITGEPLELIFGFVEFNGMRLVVHPGVFVPRQRSVLLALSVARGLAAGGRYLDLCTGNGAIAAAVRDARPDVRVLACDIDPRAVGCARINLPGCWVGEGDLFAAVPDESRGKLDAITVNAPYVPDGELARMPREARQYEPRRALAGGVDGLDVQRRVVRMLPHWLAPRGFAVLEVGQPQCASLVALCRQAGLAATQFTGEEGGYAVCARRIPGR